MAEKKKRKNMFEDYMTEVTGSKPRGLRASPSSFNAIDRFISDSAAVKEWYGGRQKDPGIGDVGLYDLRKRFKEYANKKRKPTRPKIAEKSAARAEKIQRRKRGGKVWSGNDFVREVNNYKEI